MKKFSNYWQNIFLLVTLLLFSIPSIVYNQLRPVYEEAFWFKILGVTFLPWLFMFILGIYFTRNYEHVYKYVVKSPVLIIISHVVITLILYKFFKFQLGNFMNPILLISTAVTTFSIAYCVPVYFKGVFGKLDISYGIYIYHIPIVNFILFNYNYQSYSFLAVFITLLMALIFSILSWSLIEKPALKLKKKPLYSIS